MTLCDLVTVFAETKSATKSRLHCIHEFSTNKCSNQTFFLVNCNFFFFSISNWKIYSSFESWIHEYSKKESVQDLSFNLGIQKVEMSILLLWSMVTGPPRQPRTGPCLDFGFQYALIRNKKNGPCLAQIFRGGPDADSTPVTIFLVVWTMDSQKIN